MPSIPDTDLTRASGPEVLSAPGGFFDGMQIKFLKLVERINRSQYRNDRTVILESGGPLVRWSPRDQSYLPERSNATARMIARRTLTIIVNKQLRPPLPTANLATAPGCQWPVESD